MQLISIMLITVAILTILSGAVVFFGSYKVNRARSIWFFVATIFAAIWTGAIVGFLSAENGADESVSWMVKGTYVSSIFIDVALLGYVSWRQKSGKITTLIFLAVGIVLAVIFAMDPSFLYSEIVISRAGNSLVTNVGVFYYIYIAFFCMLVPTVLITLIRQIIRAESKEQRGGSLVLMIGFAISGTSALIFNLILPFWRWDLIWVGPFMIGVTILSFYYSILRYRALNLVSRGLRILSYCVIITSAAVAYMVLFFIVFKALFRGSTPSLEVIILNFIMIMIVLLLTPAMNELMAFIQSLISPQKIDLPYIAEQLSFLSSRGVELDRIALFLADHMHFDYIGFWVDGRLYGSREFVVDDSCRKFLANLKNAENGVWQEVDKTDDAWRIMNLSAVAGLRNANGKTYGQMMFGQTTEKYNFSKQDLTRIETIVNLTAAIVDSKNSKEK